MPSLYARLAGGAEVGELLVLLPSSSELLLEDWNTGVGGEAIMESEALLYMRMCFYPLVH